MKTPGNNWKEQELNKWLASEQGQKSLSLFRPGSALRDSLKTCLALAFASGMKAAIDHVTARTDRTSYVAELLRLAQASENLADWYDSPERFGFAGKQAIDHWGGQLSDSLKKLDAAWEESKVKLECAS